jgi:hypothetical protein
MSEPSSLEGIPAYVQETIRDMQEKISEHEQQITRKKKGINSILDSYGKDAMYTDLEPAGVDAGPIHPGQFYGQALATAVRAILTKRRLKNKNGGPATVTEIYDALTEGGYLFDTDEPENAKRGLRNSLAKNSTTFHKLPTGHWGLREWYPNIKQRSSEAKEKETDQKESDKDRGDETAFDFANKETRDLKDVPA